MHEFSLAETQPIRGLLAISILLCHLCPHFKEDAPLLVELSQTIAVPIFFMMSGYGLAYSYYHKGENYLKGFFRKRLLKLLLPLIIMAAIYQSWRVCYGTFETNSLLQNISPNSWFINALVVWYLGFYICFKAGNGNVLRNNIYIWLFTILYLAITYYMGLEYYWMQILPMPLAITYVPYEDKFRIFFRANLQTVLTITSILSISFLMYAELGYIGYRMPAWCPLTLSVLPLSVFILIYILGGGNSKFLRFVGNISYEFYIVHGFIIILLADTNWFGMEGYVNALLSMAFLFTLTLSSAWIMHAICNKMDKILNV